MGFLSIRMDDRINKAILEYRSTEGEVIKQYPSESQIRAFMRSSELENSSKQSQPSAQQAPADTSGSGFQPAEVAATPTHVDVLPASTASVGGDTAPAVTAPSGGSTQSVLV